MCGSRCFLATPEILYYPGFPQKLSTETELWRIYFILTFVVLRLAVDQFIRLPMHKLGYFSAPNRYKVFSRESLRWEYIVRQLKHLEGISDPTISLRFTGISQSSRSKGQRICAKTLSSLLLFQFPCRPLNPISTSTCLVST